MNRQRGCFQAAALFALAGTLGLGSILKAQARPIGDDGFAPISKDELSLKDNPASPGSAAMILYRDVYSDDVQRYRTEYCRIKILKDEGKKYADVEIPWIPQLTEVTDLRARTIIPDGTAVEFQGEVFEKTVVKAHKRSIQVKTFTLPAVQKGGIIEYSYQVHWREKWPSLLVHPDSNVIFKHIFVIPTDDWILDQDLFVRKEHFSIRPLPSAHLAWASLQLRTGVAPKTQADGTTQLVVENIPPTTDEEFTLPDIALKSHVAFYYLLGSLWLPSPPSYWRDVAVRISEESASYFNKPKAMKQEVDSLLAPGDSAEAKLRKIYARVQQIRYLSYEFDRTAAQQKQEGLKRNNNVEDVLKHQYAAANEANLLFVGLARAAGFEAAPLLVADRSRQIFRDELPSEGQLEAMVVWVRAGKSDYYIDPATLHCPFGQLPWNEADTAGIILDAQRGGLASTPKLQSTDAVTLRKANLTLDADGKVEGKVTVDYSGEEALTRRIANRNQDEVGRRKSLEDEIREWLPADSTAELKNAPQWDGSADALHAEFAVKIPGVATSTQRRLLVPPEIFQIGAGQAFRSPTRVHGVYFDYPYQDLDEITVQIPEGYKIEAVPTARTVGSPFGRYSTTFDQENGVVREKRQLVVESTYIPSASYAQLRSFFSTVRVGDEDLVVLEAKANAQAP